MSRTYKHITGFRKRFIVSELAMRLITSLVGIPIVLACVFVPREISWLPVPGDIVWALFVTLAAFLCAGELSMIWEQQNPGSRVNWAVVLLGVMLPFDAWLSFHYPQVESRLTYPILTLFIVLGVVYEVWIADHSERIHAWSNLSSAAMIALYTGVLYRTWVSLQLHPASFPLAPNISIEGKWMLLLVCWCVWICDSSAYFLGKRYGKHKMAVRLSPKKSWEGAAAGVIGSVLTAWLFAVIYGSQFNPSKDILVPMGMATLIGVVAAVAGIIGDLFESALKREAGVKDTGAVLPGHGGVLDRFDSLMLGIPAIYLLLQLLHIIQFQQPMP